MDTDSNISSGHAESYDDTFADAMCGQWWAYATGLPSIVERSKLDSHLTKIYQNNVVKMNNGTIGAMNGVRPNGAIDTAHGQSQ